MPQVIKGDNCGLYSVLMPVSSMHVKRIVFAVVSPLSQSIQSFCLLRISFAFSDVFRYVDCCGLYGGLYVVRVRDVRACVFFLVPQAKLLLAFLVVPFSL